MILPRLSLIKLFFFQSTADLFLAMEHVNRFVVICRSLYTPHEEQCYCGFVLADINNCCRRGFSSNSYSCSDNAHKEWTIKLEKRIAKYYPRKMVEARAQPLTATKKPKNMAYLTTISSRIEYDSIFDYATLSLSAGEGQKKNSYGVLQTNRLHRKPPRRTCRSTRHRSLWLPAITVLHNYCKPKYCKP